MTSVIPSRSKQCKAQMFCVEWFFIFDINLFPILPKCSVSNLTYTNTPRDRITFPSFKHSFFFKYFKHLQCGTTLETTHMHSPARLSSPGTDSLLIVKGFLIYTGILYHRRWLAVHWFVYYLSRYECLKYPLVTICSCFDTLMDWNINNTRTGTTKKRNRKKQSRWWNCGWSTKVASSLLYLRPTLFFFFLSSPVCLCSLLSSKRGPFLPYS